MEEGLRQKKGEGGRMRLSGVLKAVRVTHVYGIFALWVPFLSSLTWHNEPYTVQPKMISVERQVVPLEAVRAGEPTTC